MSHHEPLGALEGLFEGAGKEGRSSSSVLQVEVQA